MASTELDDNCLNCEYRAEKITCEHCTDCLTECTDGCNFPGWQPQQ